MRRSSRTPGAGFPSRHDGPGGQGPLWPGKRCPAPTWPGSGSRTPTCCRPPSCSARNGLPEHCRVLGYVLPAINFEIRLPARGWNGKFLMVGCGGFCGAVDSEQSAPVHSINYGLRRGYAASTMDSGHWGTSGGDGRWAWNNWLAEIDWAERAVTETAGVTKVVIGAFYGRPPQRSYFSGCSNGGRMAAMEAQRHPEDFDGIISGCPSLAASSLHLFFTWLVRANAGPDGKDVLSGSKVGVVVGAVSRLCDARDGLEDGDPFRPPGVRLHPCEPRLQVRRIRPLPNGSRSEALEKWGPKGRGTPGVKG